MSAVELRLAAEVTECGDDVAGTVMGAAPGATANVTVALCRRAGGGGAVDDARLEATRTIADADGSARFTIDVPDEGPITYEGGLTSVRWWVEVVDHGTVVASTPVTVLPAGGLAVWAQAAAGPPAP